MGKKGFAFELKGKDGHPLNSDLVVNAQLNPNENSKYDTGIPYNGPLPLKMLTSSVAEGKDFRVNIWITSKKEPAIYTVVPLIINYKIYNDNIAKKRTNIIHITVDDIPSSEDKASQRRIIIDAEHP